MKRFKDILCVVDTSETCEPILERAVTLADNNQARLTVIDVIEKRISAGIGMPEDGPITAELKAAIVSAHTQELEAKVAPFRKKIQIETKVLTGTPFLEIIHEVLRDVHHLEADHELGVLVLEGVVAVRGVDQDPLDAGVYESLDVFLGQRLEYILTARFSNALATTVFLSA